MYVMKLCRRSGGRAADELQFQPGRARERGPARAQTQVDQPLRH
jgi:hypothetical protein